MVQWVPFFENFIYLLRKWTFSTDTIPVDNGIKGFTKPFGEQSWILSLNFAYRYLLNGLVRWNWRNRPSWGRFEWLLATPTTNNRREKYSSRRNNTRFLLEMSLIASILHLLGWGNRLNWWNRLEDIAINRFSKHIVCCFILLGCHRTIQTKRTRVQQLVSSIDDYIVALYW